MDIRHQINWFHLQYSQYPSRLSHPFVTPKLYLNFLFWYSFFYLHLFFFTALTTPSNLGGCITDYQCPTKAYPTKTLLYLISVSPCFSHVLATYESLILSYYYYLYYIFIPLDFHRFTIKSLMQFLTLQKLT